MSLPTQSVGKPGPVGSDPPVGDHKGFAPSRYARAQILIASSTIAGWAAVPARGGAKALTCVRVARSSSDFKGLEM